MNIEDDYLWDKTGEPDAEIQQLEQVLGTLRHQPRSLEIPAGLVPGRKHAFFNQRRVAIAGSGNVLQSADVVAQVARERQPLRE